MTTSGSLVVMLKPSQPTTAKLKTTVKSAARTNASTSSMTTVGFRIRGNRTELIFPVCSAKIFQKDYPIVPSLDLKRFVLVLKPAV